MADAGETISKFYGIFEREDNISILSYGLVCI